MGAQANSTIPELHYRRCCCTYLTMRKQHSSPARATANPCEA
jgi:hypothetical protein